MSSFNYIGGVWAGGSSELLNTVLRDEWGFRGMVITDYFGNYGYLSADRAIANGNDLMLSTPGRFGAMPEREDAVAVQHMRQASKNILYTVAHSNSLYTDAERNEKLAQIGGEYSGFSGFQKFALDRDLHPGRSWPDHQRRHRPVAGRTGHRRGAQVPQAVRFG